MRTFLLYAIPITFIIVSVAVITSGSWIKESDEDLLLYVQNIEAYAKEENWEEAEREQAHAKVVWDRIAKRVQFSVPRNDVLAISESLSRMKGGIEQEDADSIVPEAYHFYELWETLGW
ncbi:DUF4363 family protein [Natribacillus halophilus]|uniref:DUF4363 family protein n=1 Tax=Natribacillus halophilus TaxID=549003 RepID=A0A1G8J4I8_9BACI|nr:DUF4363 family protein [Natribacillus halophilus]SDI26175.1 protein of unknown function [Natribacillus halophilus]